MIFRSVFRLVAPVLASTTAAASLFASTPSEKEAERYWSSRFSNSNGLLRMMWFKKTDGAERPGGYTLYYSLTFMVTEDCQYDRDYKATKGLPQTEMERLAGMFDKAQGRKGQHLVQSGEMHYEKRESGWVLVGVENTQVSESEASRESRAAEEEKRRQQAAQEEEVRQAPMKRLIEKSKEEKRIIKTAVVNDSSRPPREFKLTLTDSGIRYESYAGGKRVLWFGDVRRMWPFYGVRNDYQLAIDSSVRDLPIPNFSSKEQLDDFYKSCLEAMAQWQKDNSALWGK